MPLTGRAVYSRKALAENAKAIDMTFLRAKGFFDCTAGTNWTSSWTRRGEPWGTVSYWREDCHGEPFLFWLSYNFRKEGDDWHPLKYAVEMESTRCHFGGVRHWFICPLVLNGRPCRRRCRALYLGASEYFGCRECQRLTYQSRRNHRDKFWELCGKHDHYLEKAYSKYRTPRGRKAKARRCRMLALADHRRLYGEVWLARSWAIAR